MAGAPSPPHQSLALPRAAVSAANHTSTAPTDVILTIPASTVHQNDIIDLTEDDDDDDDAVSAPCRIPTPMHPVAIYQPTAYSSTYGLTYMNGEMINRHYTSPYNVPRDAQMYSHHRQASSGYGSWYTPASSALSLQIPGAHYSPVNG